MRRMKLAALLMFSAMMAALPAVGRQEPAPPPPPPIKELMGSLNQGPDALTSMIGRNLDRASPDWRTLGELCSTYVDQVEQLGRNVPPRGEPGSWKRLTEGYLDHARAMARAVKRRDRKAALAEHGRIEQACARCHVEHKP